MRLIKKFQAKKRFFTIWLHCNIAEDDNCDDTAADDDDYDADDDNGKDDADMVLTEGQRACLSLD